jgi:urease accessory protein
MTSSNCVSGNRYGRDSVLRCEAALHNGVTELRDVYFTAPLKLLPPHPVTFAGLQRSGDDVRQGIRITALSVSAGLMAGDTQRTECVVRQGAAAEFTTQAYEKIHKMDGGGEAVKDCSFTVESGALLHYKPHPVIPFAGSSYRGAVRFALADNTSTLIYRDVFCPGRIAMGELFAFTRYRQLVEIRIGSRLLYRENSDYCPAAGTLVDTPTVFEQYTHTGTLLFINTNLTLAAVNAALNDALAAMPATEPGATAPGSVTAGASHLSDGLSVAVKALGSNAEDLEKFFDKVLSSVCL